MVFSSITFLFFFLPAVILLYYLAPRRAHNAVLLVASLVFYTWGTGALVFVLVLSIGINYGLGLAVERSVDAGRDGRARAFLAAAILFNVSVLAWFKYATFALAQLNRFFGFIGTGSNLPVLEILLPIGISFYTFHSLSYLIDIYRGTARHLVSPLDFALYITLFPQLVAGPIVRFHEIRDQLVERHERRDMFAIGVYRFAHGFAKKVLVADTVAPLADAAFTTPTSDLTSVAAVVGVAAYTVQIYFDFSGYSDMAIGLAHMFGIRLPENFARPYSSRSMTEFWRRWHMSLSRWFRDYLYFPLGGNRGSPGATYRNLIIVFLATGIWHGANWTFVVWGGYHGTLLLIERRFGVGRTTAAQGSAFAWARTFGLVVFGWILFRSPGLGYAVGYVGALLHLGTGLPDAMASLINPITVVMLLVGVASALLPATWVTGRRLEDDRSPLAETLRWGVVGIALPLALIFLVATGFSPFLYFQF